MAATADYRSIRGIPPFRDYVSFTYVTKGEEQMAGFQPLHDRVLLKRIEAPNKKGSLFIPDSAKERPGEAHVVAAGPGRTAEDGTVRPLGVRVGDQVLVGKYSGSEIEIEGVEYVIVREDEILGVRS